MSHMGQSRPVPSAHVRPNFRCSSSSDHSVDQSRTDAKGQFRSFTHAHSITSSAIASTPGGKLRPNVLAVLRLITNSNLVDCMTGRSAGFSPLRIRPVYTPACRYEPVMLVP